MEPSDAEFLAAIRQLPKEVYPEVSRMLRDLARGTFHPDCIYDFGTHKVYFRVEGGEYIPVHIYPDGTEVVVYDGLKGGE